MPTTGQRFVVFIALLAAAGLFPDPVAACGGKAVPPRCGRTVVITGASPTTVLTTGGTIDLNQLIYFGLIEFPAGSGQCPLGPFLLDIDVTVTCTPSGDAVASVSDLPIVPGYTEVPVSVTIPAGPPRVCAVESIATVASGDGAEITSSGDGQVLCVSDIVAPGVPRLEMVPPPDPILFVHPGDQSHHVVQLVNNDPAAAFNGTLEVETQNRSKVPGLVPSGAPGDDVFSVSDPGNADNFPIAFADQVAACVPLPLDPLAATIPTLTRPIVLGPGESTEIEILTRPWGMCSDGSCSQSQMVVTGDFSDLTPGVACTSFVTATELAQPPSFLWPDAGSSALVQPPLDPSDGSLVFLGQPTLDSDPLGLLTAMGPPQLLPPLLPPAAGGLFAEPLDPERGRWRATFDLDQPILPGLPFQVVLPIQFQPEPGGLVTGVELLSIDHLIGAPIGFDQFQPLFMGTLGLTHDVGGLQISTEMQFTMQLTLFTLDPLGQPLAPLPLAPLPSPPGLSGLDLALQAVIPVPPRRAMIPGPPPPGAERFQVDVDLRFHSALGSAFAPTFDADEVASGQRALGPLHYNDDEVRRIGPWFERPRLLVGDVASESQLKRHARSYRHLHLATHGLVDDQFPLGSGVLLAEDRENDGSLQVAEVLDLDLQADLVTLSACRSGRGRLGRGEGIVGLGQAFLYAGASSLVLSLWDVDDSSTPRLMESFYRHLTAGRSPAEALRDARRELFAQTEERTMVFRRRPMSLAHPRFWSAFVVTGDG